MTEKEISQDSVQHPSEILYKEHPTPFDELKHSIHIHWTIMNGPTPQLAVFLMKAVDFIEVPDENQRGMSILSYSIIEAVAMHIQRSVDERAARAEQRGIKFPRQVKQQGDNILVLMGKVRSSENKAEAKIVLLRGVADTLRSLTTFTKAPYPSITDASGNTL